MWRDVNSTVSDLVTASSEFADKISSQGDAVRRLSEEESKRERVLREAARQKKLEDRESAERDKATHSRVKEFGRTLSGITSDFGSWAANHTGGSGSGGGIGSLLGRAGGAAEGLGGILGGIGGTLALGLGTLLGGGGALLAGSYMIAQRAAGQYRDASGMGVRTGQMQGADINMQRYFDVNQTMGNLSVMQHSPSQWGSLAMLGMNPRKGNAADMTYEASMKARALFLKQGQNLDIAEGEGLTKIFSPQDLMRLARSSPGELKKSIADAKAFDKKYGTTDEEGRRMTRLQVSMDTLTSRIQNGLTRVVSDSVPVLNYMIQNMMKLGDAVGKTLPFFEKVASWVGGGNGQTPGTSDPNYNRNGGPDTPVTNVAPGGMNSASVDYFQAGDSLWNKAKSMFTLRSPDRAAKAAAEQFQKWGWSKAQTAGIIGNINSEDATWNPFAEGDYNKKLGRNTAYGIGQWHQDRQDIFAQQFHHTMKSVKDPTQALREELEFYQWELTHSEKKAGDSLKRQLNASDAAYTVGAEFERNKAGGEARRGAGVSALKVILSNQTGASIATSTNAAAG